MKGKCVYSVRNDKLTKNIVNYQQL